MAAGVAMILDIVHTLHHGGANCALHAEWQAKPVNKDDVCLYSLLFKSLSSLDALPAARYSNKHTLRRYTQISVLDHDVFSSGNDLLCSGWHMNFQSWPVRRRRAKDRQL